MQINQSKVQPVPNKTLGKKAYNLPQNVVCCVKKPGLERYGVKMLFETRQIRVGSRFKDTKSASSVARHFRKIVRISDAGRFYIAENEALQLRKEANDTVKYYLKFSQEFKVEHVVDFLIGWVQYMKSRPSPKPRKKRRANTEDSQKKKRKRDLSSVCNVGIRKKTVLPKNNRNAAKSRMPESLIPDVFLHSAHILKLVKGGTGKKAKAAKNSKHRALSKHLLNTNGLSKTIFDPKCLSAENIDEEIDDDETVSMTREHSFGHESPNSVTHSPTESSWELLSKLIDAERAKQQLKMEELAKREREMFVKM